MLFYFFEILEEIFVSHNPEFFTPSNRVINVLEVFVIRGRTCRARLWRNIKPISVKMGKAASMKQEPFLDQLVLAFKKSSL